MYTIYMHPVSVGWTEISFKNLFTWFVHIYISYMYNEMNRYGTCGVKRMFFLTNAWRLVYYDVEMPLFMRNLTLNRVKKGYVE